MPANLLEQLAEQAVPDTPPELDLRVHQRLNGRLLAVHVAETVFSALPFAFVCFFQALTGSLVYSLTGRFPKEGEDHARRNDKSGN